MPIEYRKEGKIAYFTINRPEALNAMNLTGLRELGQFLADFRDDNDVWVGILTATGERAFCAGADVKEMLPFMSDNEAADPRIPPTHLRGMDLWKPMIAAINGMALGGGLELALACDLRVSVEGAIFGSPEIKLGLIPGWGATQRIPRMIPWCKAAEILLTGKPINAQEAYRIGLINKIVPREQLMSAAKEYADAICECGPLAVRASKEAMVRGTGMTLEDGLRLEYLLESYLQKSEDYKEGTTAFVQKRKPQYKGQ